MLENGATRVIKVRWKNRRRMAWVSMFNIVAFTILLLFYPFSIEKLDLIKSVSDWFYIVNVSVIGAYMGFTSWVSK